MGTDRDAAEVPSYLIELEESELMLLIHAACLGRSQMVGSADAAELTKLLQRLQGVRDEVA